MSIAAAEKPKNEFEKAKYDENPSNGVYRERGGCLTVFLSVIILFNGASAIDTLTKLPQIGRLLELQASMPNLLPLAQLTLFAMVLNIISVVFALGMWRWKKWGYYGLGVLNVLLALVLLVMGNVFGVVAAGINLAVLNAVYTPRIDMFE